MIDLIAELLRAVEPVWSPAAVVIGLYATKVAMKNTDHLTDLGSKLTKNDIVMLRSRIKERGDLALDKGSISEEELSELESLYERYKEIGGNSFIDHLMERVRKLEVK